MLSSTIHPRARNMDLARQSSHLSSFAGPALLLIASFLLPGVAGAMPVLPLTVFEEQVGGAQTPVFGSDLHAPETVVLSVATANYGTADGWATTSGGALPSATASLVLNGFHPYGTAGGAAARIQYWWAVTQIAGDPFAGQVPVDFVTSGRVSRGGSGDYVLGSLFARATFGGLAQFQANLCDGYGCYLGGDNFSETFSSMITPEVAYSVELYALGYNGVAPNGTVDFFASVDPRITIDPAFPQRDQFRIMFSSGISEFAAVPEPAPFWLFATGLALLGAVIQPRSRTCDRRGPFARLRW
jgi:hypothetical protein